jgi:hypothetical protein
MALKISNWEEKQTYRKDRGTPPWIKVHRTIFTNEKWAALSDAEKGQLVSLWVVAADKNGIIPSDPRALKKVAQLDDIPNINKFIELGLLTSDGCQAVVSLTPSGCQVDAAETETEERQRQNPPIVPLKVDEDISRDLKTGVASITNPPRPKRKARVPTAEAPGFEDFWAAYPKKLDKQEARDKWNKIKPSPELLVKILASLEAQKQSVDWTKENGQYIQKAKNWLKNENWAVEAVAVQANSWAGVEDLDQKYRGQNDTSR